MALLWELALFALLMGRQASSADEPNPLCDNDLAFRAANGDALKNQCAYEAVVQNYINRGLNFLNLKSKNDTGYKEAKKHLKTALKEGLPNGADKTVDVTIHNVDLAQIYTYTQRDQITIKGLLNLTWTDPRLSWTAETKPANTDKFVLKSDKEIWVPDLGYVLYRSVFGSEDTSERETIIYKEGKVSYHLGFYVRGTCPMDVSEYPNDVHHCCIQFRSSKSPHLLKLKLRDGQQIGFTRTTQNYFWNPSPRPLKVTEDEKGYENLQLCLDLSRKSATANYLIKLPLGCTTLLAVVVPLFADWRMQIFTKFGALVLQFLAFTLTLDPDLLLYADTVPKYIKLYDFVIWTTAVSLSVTIILWALTKRDKHAMPPPHMMTLLSAKINALFCGNPPPQVKTVGTSPEAGSPPNGNYETMSAGSTSQAEWAAVLLALNNLFLIAFTIVYVLGIVVLVI